MGERHVRYSFNTCVMTSPMSNPLADASDRTKKAIRYLSYGVIGTYGLLANELLLALVAVLLLQIITELKRHRYQRALMFEEDR